MRREPDFFGDKELVLIYIGKKLREAKAVEKAFDDAGIDYAIEVDYYAGGLIFRSERAGAFFYVDPTQEELAAKALANGGYRRAVQ
ncbi:MAG: hypothetical protein IT168_10400 [Bryobacterales bacterium]|nr:hypothetical protein [Bryobacterales bacterium]